MREHLVAFAGGAYFTRGPLWQPLHAAALMIEGLAVAVAGERVLRRHPGATTHVLWMFLAGVAAVALLNVAQLIEVAAREGDLLSSMPALGLQLRVSRFYDVNAAGTVFVMTGLAAFGLGRESWRWLLVAASPLLLLGLWLSGSRTAIGTLVLMLSAALVHAMLVTHGRRRWVAGLTLGLLAASAIVVAALYPADRNASAVPAFATRRILAATSVEMWRSAPVFGIGVGRFHAESSRFGGMALREELNFGTANENAHNNFLQVLGELGLAGLLVLVILLGDTLAAALRSERQSSSTVRYWLIAGVGAGLMTWLTGHPLLVPDAAFAFWMLFGVLSAMTAPPAGRVLPVAATILTLAIAAAAPVRTYTARASADLEHVGIGVSVWQPDPSVDRYREAGADFALYLPADGSTLTLPMRRAPAAPNPVRVAFAAHGQLLNEVVIDSSAWHPIPISLPSRGRRFELVQFRVTADQPLSDNRSILHVGIVR
jgi:O-antigen ligase